MSAAGTGGAVSGRVEDVGRIAVLRCNALGDLLMARPALTALHDAYPDAELTLLGARWHAAFLHARAGPVRRVRVLPRVEGLAGQPAGAPPPAELAGFLAAERYDLVLQMHGGGAVSNPLVARLGARVSAGLRAPGAPALDRTVPYRVYQPEEARYLEVAALVGAAPPPVVGPLAVSPDERRRAEALLPASGRPLVAVHAGATDTRRRWPPARFAALVAALGRDVDIVMVGGPGDAVACPGAVDLTGRTDLSTLTGVLARAQVVVGNDSGPLHLARAVGTATVGLYWCGNAINAAPSTRARHRPLLSWRTHCPVCGADCTPAGFPHRLGTGCSHRPSFLDQIPVAEVVEEVRSLLDGGSAAPPW